MAAAALEQSILESKDKDTLLEMAKALGVKANARLKKGEIIDKILDTTGSGPSAGRSGAPSSSTPTSSAPVANGAGSPVGSSKPTVEQDGDEQDGAERDGGADRPSTNGAPAT